MISAVATHQLDKVKKFERFAGVTPTILASSKFAPVILYDIEQSFSAYQRLFAENRMTDI